MQFQSNFDPNASIFKKKFTKLLNSLPVGKINSIKFFNKKKHEKALQRQGLNPWQKLQYT